MVYSHDDKEIDESLMYYYKTNAGKYITEEEMIGQPWILREGGGWGDRELGP